MTKVKICGLTRPEDIACVNRERPDYIGFVFAEKSRRAVTQEQAMRLRQQLADGIVPVGVFVNAPEQTVLQLLRSGVIDIAQLHGSETEAQIAALRQQTEKPIWKAFSVKGREDLAAANACKAQMVLLDSGPGGTGSRFDWTLLRHLNRPYVLAGGLDPETVAQALRQIQPFAVDVSSGVETDGKKDPQKIAAFLAAVRAAQKERTTENGEENGLS